MRSARVTTPLCRASTMARGTPSARHSRVLAVAVRRLSASASRAAGVVISEPNRGQSTLAASASTGSATKAAPAAAGR